MKRFIYNIKNSLKPFDKRKCSVLLLFLFCTGCSYYSVSGALPSHIKTCAVPYFENETIEVNIVEQISNEIRDAIIDDGNMKVVSEFQADAIVSGTIVDIMDSEDTYSKDEAAEKFRITVYANVTFFDRKKNLEIWSEKNMEGWAVYDASNTAAREEAILEALEMLAKEIIDKTVSGW